MIPRIKVPCAVIRGSIVFVYERFDESVRLSGGSDQLHLAECVTGLYWIGRNEYGANRKQIAKANYTTNRHLWGVRVARQTSSPIVRNDWLILENVRRSSAPLTEILTDLHTCESRMSPPDGCEGLAPSSFISVEGDRLLRLLCK